MTGLVVPIDLLAYCVGLADATRPAQTFAGATTDYRNQTTSERPAFLGVNVQRDYDAPPLWPLEAGVHLHWAMPDALTRAVTSDQALTFPPLPNRWMVSRLRSSDTSTKHWIIESDTLSTTPPPGTQPPTIPVSSVPNYRYLGVTAVYTADWTEPQPAPGQSIKDLTGSELNAVTTGDIAFAAFYPNCRGVFGFLDQSDDLDSGGDLTYVVTGWYGTPANDPLTAGLCQAELEAQLEWTLPTTPSADPSFSVYSGTVHGVQWASDGDYLLDASGPITGDVALGHSSAEALAAYVRNSEASLLADYEELLTIYLAGLAPGLAEPAPGQLAELDEALHELEFTGYSGGTIYTIRRGTDEVTELPLALADALNLLNQRQQAADLAAVQVSQAKWQLFAAWARLFEVAGTDLRAALTAFDDHLDLQTPISTQQTQSAAAASAQHAVVQAMLSGDLTLTEAPAPRFYAPNEPVVLLAGAAAAPATRYGGDGAYDPNGYLVCRLDSDLLSAVTIGTVPLEATDYSGLAPEESTALPSAVVRALVMEAVMIDPGFAAAKTGETEAELAADLTFWLTGQTTTLYLDATGAAPSPIEVNTWPGSNPLSSLLMLWQADFHPLLATTGATKYPPGYVTANFDLDPDQPRLIAYTPTAAGITVDPSKITFDPTVAGSGTQRYRGASILSPTAVDNFRAQLAQSLATTPDRTLLVIAELFGGIDVQLQGLTGFSDALLTRQQGVQLMPGGAPTAPALLQAATAQLTSAVSSLDQLAALAPDFDGAFSGVPAGFLQLSLQVVDPFGFKRPVAIQNFFPAQGLTAYAAGSTTPVPGVAYVQPRLAQPSRLLFRWLAADSTEYDEMNAHPATTPVCGWLLPSHLEVGFFVYSSQGNPLGTLTRTADGTAITWQATPGNQATIDADLATVMAHQNPHLRDVVTALGAATPAWFSAVYEASDTAVTQIVPTTSASQVGLVALVGRPLALVQASLRMEQQGLPAYDQSLGVEQSGTFPNTGHGTGGVQFPVVIGDLTRLDDGLVGYWTQATDGSFDTSTFYSEAASGASGEVVVPSPTNLLLVPQALSADDPSAPLTESKLLMLVDPRAGVHVTTGVLPTQHLVIPADQYEDLMDALEVTVPVTPVLRPAGGLQVPLPAIAGFNWSWVEEEPGPLWGVDPAVTSATAGAVWQYSPQTLTEGWLRLNPEQLSFSLTGPGGLPVVTAGETVTMSLTITNTRQAAITFPPLSIGTLGGPEVPPLGQFFIYFGALVSPAQVAAIQPVASGWELSAMTDPQYGTYLAAVPDGEAVTLPPSASFTVTIGNVTIATQTSPQVRVYFEYIDVIGVDDGIEIAILSVQPATD